MNKKKITPTKKITPKKKVEQPKEKRPVSLTHREHLRNANAWRFKKIVMMDEDTFEELRTFECMGDAVRYLKVNGWPKAQKTGIIRVCNRRQQTAYEYRWRYL